MGNTFAVVTGASSGIGLELAKVLAGKGYDLLVTAESDRLDAALAEFNSFGVSVQGVKANLADKEGVDVLWKAIEATGRPVDVACINAGVGVGGLFTETDLQEELNIVLLNCASTVHLAKHIVKKMVGRGEGRILFSASIASEMVAPREAVYAASKAFVLSFAKSLRYELKDTGVGITALQPGPTDTDFFHRAGMDDTEVGSKGKLDNEPETVAKQGIEALFAGDEHIYAGSMKLKAQGAMMNVVPTSVQGAMHEKQAKPVQ